MREACNGSRGTLEEWYGAAIPAIYDECISLAAPTREDLVATTEALAHGLVEDVGDRLSSSILNTAVGAPPKVWETFFQTLPVYVSSDRRGERDRDILQGLATSMVERRVASWQSSSLDGSDSVLQVLDELIDRSHARREHLRSYPGFKERLDHDLIGAFDTPGVFEAQLRFELARAERDLAGAIAPK